MPVFPASFKYLIWKLDSILVHGVVPLCRACGPVNVTYHAHHGVLIGLPEEDGAILLTLPLASMGTMTGPAVDISVHIQGERPCAVFSCGDIYLFGRLYVTEMFTNRVGVYSLGK